MNSERAPSLSALPLCVDVDGSLLRTDILYESLCLLMRTKPWMLFLVPLWLLKGKAFLKRRLAEEVTLPVVSLPINDELLRQMQSARVAGRRVLLASASDERVVRALGEHIGCVDEVLASDGTRNLRAEAKRDALIAKFGEGRFAYVGNDTVDLPVWRAAGEQHLVSSDSSFVARVRAEFPGVTVYPGGKGVTVRVLLKALRVHQWVKNLLLFLPAIMAHRLLDPQAVSTVLLGFCAFSACASAVYLMNDLVDLEADRVHPAKRNRPLAAGTLPIQYGLLLVPLLLLTAAFAAAWLPVAFQIVLLGYLMITTAYSLFLKRLVLIDIITLALLYAVRVLAGGYAANIAVSQWLLAFSLFIFVSLAAVKRFSELYGLKIQNRERTQGRGYFADDLDQIAQFGSASGYISVLVMALYVSSADVARLYARPQVMWLVCPVLLYWISRIWLLAHRGLMHEDPIVFALQDRASYVVGVIVFFLIMLAL